MEFSVIEISEEIFEMHPTQRMLIMHRELGWFKSRHTLGVVVQDHIDGDYGVVVLGKDMKGTYRAIDLSIGITDYGDACTRLTRLMRDHDRSGDTRHPPGVWEQGDEGDDNAETL